MDRITTEDRRAFMGHLRQEECARGTVEKYLRDLGGFARWLNGGPETKEAVAAWKEHLFQQQYAPTTINSMLAAVNTFLHFLGREDCRVKFLKVQRKLFREPQRELSREEYHRLQETTAALGRERLALVMETISATGIRVSELQYITIEALRRGRAEIALKGKIRTILLPGKLCRKLQKYARKNKIASGEVFLTRSGKPIQRRQVWAEMKRLCERAGVAESKVFPHNLRHLFATAFYKSCKDIARLADVLGHSSIETTRIYLLTTGQEHRRAIERLGFVT